MVYWRYDSLIAQVQGCLRFPRDSVHRTISTFGGHSLRTASRGLFVFAGLLAAPMAREVRIQAVEHRQTEDSRLVRLQHYLEENDCPLNKLAADFIEAADRQELDW